MKIKCEIPISSQMIEEITAKLWSKGMTKNPLTLGRFYLIADLLLADGKMKIYFFNGVHSERLAKRIAKYIKGKI